MKTHGATDMLAFLTVLLALLIQGHDAFVVFAPAAKRSPMTTTTTSRHMGFFKGILDKAFENDSSLSQEDKRAGQLEGPGEFGDDDGGAFGGSATPSRSGKTLTATQEKWRQLQRSSVPSLADSAAEMDFYLTGVPNKDPSNDLFGSRVNVSSRDRQVGLAVPDKPTVGSIRIEFLVDEAGDGKCRCVTDSAFTSSATKPDEYGDWKVSDDGKQVRFRIPVNGFKRTIQTKGTIQKIYWSDEDDQTIDTTTTYSIPPGWMYGEAELSGNAKGDAVQWNAGVLKVEQSVGLLGAASKMIPCGKFEARTVLASAAAAAAAAAKEAVAVAVAAPGNDSQ